MSAPKEARRVGYPQYISHTDEELLALGGRAGLGLATILSGCRCSSAMPLLPQVGLRLLAVLPGCWAADNCSVDKRWHCENRSKMGVAVLEVALVGLDLHEARLELVASVYAPR
eukprot:4733322-Amphidinium_carterae.5